MSISDAASQVVIAGRRIGEGQRTFVVAEAGVNHNGRADEAITLVDAAVEAGADAVKFQFFCAAALTVATAPTAPYQRERGGGDLQHAMLSSLELSADEFRRIKMHCDERGITFLATPFGVAELRALIELRVAAIKIASTDLTNVPLLEAAIDSRLPLILSTGASTEDEIRGGIALLRTRNAANRAIFLHCVSAYPTPIEALNLRAMESLTALSHGPVGLSDHTTSVEAGAWAVAAGARVLEKHFTLDRSAIGPDHAMSLSPTQLAEYVARVRDVESAMGSAALGMQPLEAGVREVARRSIVATRRIARGEFIAADALSLKRPGTGIPPLELSRIIGKRAEVEIPADTLLAWNMLA